jgi:hypothetical protein
MLEETILLNIAIQGDNPAVSLVLPFFVSDSDVPIAIGSDYLPHIAPYYQGTLPSIPPPPPTHPPPTPTPTCTNEVPTSYSCQVCQQYFANAKRFNYHMKTHSNTSTCPFDSCKKVFASKHVLKRHLETHNPVPVPCDFPDCRSTFTRRDVMLKHKKKHDKDDPNVLPKLRACPLPIHHYFNGRTVFDKLDFMAVKEFIRTNKEPFTKHKYYATTGSAPTPSNVSHLPPNSLYIAIVTVASGSNRWQ